MFSQNCTMLFRLFKWVALACLSPSLSTVKRKIATRSTWVIRTVSHLASWHALGDSIGVRELLFVPHTVDDPLDALHVSVGVEQDALRDLSVSAGSSRLLVVTLHWFRQSGVDHIAHIGLVNAHAEGYGGTDDLADKREQWNQSNVQYNSAYTLNPSNIHFYCRSFVSVPPTSHIYLWL